MKTINLEWKGRIIWSSRPWYWYYQYCTQYWYYQYFYQNLPVSAILEDIGHCRYWKILENTGYTSIADTGRFWKILVIPVLQILEDSRKYWLYQYYRYWKIRYEVAECTCILFFFCPVCASVMRGRTVNREKRGRKREGILRITWTLCIQIYNEKIYDKKVQVLSKYCYLYFTWELISAYTVCDFDKNVLVLLRN